MVLMIVGSGMGASLGSGSERFFDPGEVAIGRGGPLGIKLQKKCDAEDFCDAAHTD